MLSGQGRKLLAGIGALVASTLGAGCQTFSLPSLPGRGGVDSRAYPYAAASPIRLGPPVVAAASVRGSGPVATVWRPVQRPASAPEGVLTASAWHQAQRANASPTSVVTAAGGPAPLVLSEAQKDGGPADLEGSRTAAIPPPVPRTPAREPDSLLPLPRPLVAAPANGVVQAVPLAHAAPGPVPGHAPRELAKVQMPPYIIEPPDILLVDATTAVAEKLQRIRGPHLVRPDGSISLGVFGSARVAGLTVEQARSAIADAINSSPEGVRPTTPIKTDVVSVDVQAYNSKVYYLITDGGGYGEQVYRLAFTGNETVLDAVSQINGLPPVASKKHIWVARRVPDHGGSGNILPVDWKGITQGGSAATNYQILPGDRIYVQSDHLIRIDSGLAKILSPIERVLGTTLLGSETVNSIRNRGTTTTP